MQAQEVCTLVGQRGGRLIAAAISALLYQMQRDGTRRDPSEPTMEPVPRTVIGVDGGVYDHYSNYRAAIRYGLEELIGKDAAAQVVLRQVPHASSLGAAYLAAAAAHADIPASQTQSKVASTSRSDQGEYSKEWEQHLNG